MARTLGIDIGSNSVRAALVKGSLRKLELERCFEVPYFAEEQTQDVDLEQAKALALRELTIMVGRGPDTVIVSIEGEDASLRPIELPEAAAKRIAEVLPFELEAVLPYEVEDTVLTHQLIERADGKLRLLAAAVPKDRVRARIESLSAAGIVPGEIAVGAAALDGLAALVPSLTSDAPQMIIDIGAARVDVCIVRKGSAEFARTLSLTSAGLDEATRVVIGRALVQTIASYRAMGRAEPEAVWLVGGHALDPSVSEWLTQTLNVAAQPLPLPPMPNGPPEAGVLYGRALALAARVHRRGPRLDLRQGEFARKRAIGAIRQHAPLLVACASLIIASLGFSSWASYRVVSKRNDQLREELANVTKAVFGTEARDARSASELLSGGARTSDPLPRFDAFDVLDALSRNIEDGIPHDTRRVEIEIPTGNREGHLELKGQVAEVAELDRIAEALNTHPCLHDSEKRSSAAANQTRVDYQIGAVIRCGEAPTKNKNKNGGAR